MKIAIAGGTGFIGRALVDRLKDKNQITIITRQKLADSEKIKYFQWSLSEQNIQSLSDLFSNTDVVINLAGEPISNKRWNNKVKDAILKSRVDTTRYIANAIEKANKKPEMLINGSAIGYYRKIAGKILMKNPDLGTIF